MSPGPGNSPTPPARRPSHLPSQPPVVALLAPRWETRSEEGWITRQVAGALAGSGPVHIITPEGRAPGTTTDSVFTVHRLGTPIDPSSEASRRVVIDSVAATGGLGDRAVAQALSTVIDRHRSLAWEGATAVLDRVQPDLVVIAGHANLGALDAVDASSPDRPMVLLALGADRSSLAFPLFDPMFERAAAVMAVTEWERQAIVDRHGDPGPVHRIGAPMAANTSALSEPNPWTGDRGYVFVITGRPVDDTGPEAEMARLVRLRFAERGVGVSSTDAFDAWVDGTHTHGWSAERASDLARLMAWATVTVDLRPGPLLARRCLDSLLFGTPIVVPADSAGRQHAERGRGGLWFTGASELTWCVEGLLDPQVATTLGAQGRAYAEEEFGSTDRFIERVTAACGLPPA